MRGLRSQLGDVIEVDMVLGAGSRSHYELQTLGLTVVVSMLGRMVVVTLVYQNQGNVRSAGWCRPKEREAERIDCQQDRTQLSAKPV